MRGSELIAFRRVGQLTCGLRAEQRLAKTLLRVVCEGREHDGAVEGGETGVPVDGEMQRRDVAVADEDFRIAANQIVVNSVKQLHRTVAAAYAEDGLHFRVAKHRVQII